MPISEKESFAGRVAFATGAASGIGHAAALVFARDGASVVVADISEPGNQETALLAEGFGHGHGHRRRARRSRGVTYETIEGGFTS